MQSLKIRLLMSHVFKNLSKSNYEFFFYAYYINLTTTPLLYEFKSLNGRIQCITQDTSTQPVNKTGKCRIIEYYSRLQNFM